MERELLTTREAAALLGVGDSSVKRWADAGQLACVKTLGGHRRFEREALLALRERGLPADDEAGDPGAAPADPVDARDVDGDPWLERWVAALIEPASTQALVDLLRADRAAAASWAETADRLGLVLDALGQRWASGAIGVIDEHVASGALGRALARCADDLPVPAAPRAVLLTAEGDDHTLGLSLAEVVLRAAGVATVWLGRVSPLRFVADHVAAGGVDLVCVSASVMSRDRALLADQAERLGVACEHGGATLILGGRGAWPERPRSGHRVRSFIELEALLARIT